MKRLIGCNTYKRCGCISNCVMECNTGVKPRITKVRGSLTVEAVFVMPIVVLTIVSIIYLSFYLHDLNKIHGVVDITLHKTAITIKHKADLITGKVDYEHINDRGVFYLINGSTEGHESAVKEFLIRELSKGLFLANPKNIQITVDKFKLTVTVIADVTVSIPGLNYLFNKISRLEVKGDYSVHNPAELIRRSEVILETGSNIKGVDELQDKLEDFFQ